MKIAIITGISGQDGAYLAKLLLGKGYSVFGTHRRSTAAGFWRLQEVGIADHPELKFIEHDVTDLSSTIRLLQHVQPDEIYNLAAQSFVGVSFDQPTATAEVTGLGVLNLLEAIRFVNPAIRFYQASTSEMFGKAQSFPQDETTPFWPRSPYAVSKLFAHWMTVNYREAHGIFASSGILFNHESPLRGHRFVTGKITAGVAQIKAGALDAIELGNIDARRDWGFAGDYVEGMWRMLQAEAPDTFILATGRTRTVRDFVSMAFAVAGIDVAFEGNGCDEIARDTSSGKIVMRINPTYYRLADVEFVVGNASKAREVLGWESTCSVEELCAMMVEADLRRAFWQEGKIA